MTKLITRIAPDVGWLPISFANVYFVGRPGHLVANEKVEGSSPFTRSSLRF